MIDVVVGGNVSGQFHEHKELRNFLGIHIKQTDEFVPVAWLSEEVQDGFLLSVQWGPRPGSARRHLLKHLVNTHA